MNGWPAAKEDCGYCLCTENMIVLRGGQQRDVLHSGLRLSPWPVALA